LLACGCHAGWLQSGSGGGITINTGGDSIVTTRLAAVEGQVADLTARELNMTGRGLTWTAGESNRNWTGAGLSMDGRYQTAVVQHGVIYGSSDYGNTWTATGSTADWAAVALSADGARQTACAYDGQLHVSTNYGVTWAAVGSTQCWQAVAMSADGLYQAAVVDNGFLYTSTNGGGTWAANLTAEAQNWRRVGVSSNGQYQTAACERHEDGDDPVKFGGGLYVSSDYGSTWTLKEPERDWNGVVVCGNGARQVACAGGAKIYVSVDYGSTWAAREENRAWRGLAVSTDGKMVFGLVAGEPVYVSADYGATWTNAGPVKWWSGVATSGDGAYQIATIQGGQLWAARAAAKVRGSLTADFALGIGSAGEFMIRGGTQLVFVAGGVVNVIDADILNP
jgi:hypothetical protein